MIMGAIGWIVLGLTAGYIASAVANKRGEALRMNTVLGIVGALLGGWLFGVFDTARVAGFNSWSLLAAGIGAAALLVIGHLLRRPAWHG